ncbi:MAG TPA: hypothetical protein VH255_04390, partial [Verrucomicrobiae bacterium]|nr:hypothetical protein [Verrucomicrobiae bacterium]
MKHLTPSSSWPFAAKGLALIAGLFFFSDAFAGSPRQQISMDANWKFFQGNLSGAEDSGFDDSSWRTVNVPYDWSIQGPFAE